MESNKPILTICICSLEKRAGLLARLLRELYKQIEELENKDEVEIKVELDGGQATTGLKRNKLYHEANGLYVCSHDDDDWPAAYYVKELLNACKQNPDAVAMNGTITTNGRDEKVWFISKDLPYKAAWDGFGREIYLRYHNHLSAVKKEIAIQFPFPEVTRFEDKAYADAMHASGLIKSEIVIGTTHGEYVVSRMQKPLKPMYQYNYIHQK